MFRRCMHKNGVWNVYEFGESITPSIGHAVKLYILCTESHTWWRHQMEAFSALLALCAGNSLVTGEFLSQRSVTRSFGVFFDLRPNKRLSKQWRRRWFETPRAHYDVSVMICSHPLSVYVPVSSDAKKPIWHIHVFSPFNHHPVRHRTLPSLCLLMF